jgi:hypothetical protein
MEMPYSWRQQEKRLRVLTVSLNRRDETQRQAEYTRDGKSTLDGIKWRTSSTSITWHGSVCVQTVYNMTHLPCQPSIFFSPFPRTDVVHRCPPCCTQYHSFASRCGSHEPPESTSNRLDACSSATPQSCSRTLHGWEYFPI